MAMLTVMEPFGNRYVLGRRITAILTYNLEFLPQAAIRMRMDGLLEMDP